MLFSTLTSGISTVDELPSIKLACAKSTKKNSVDRHSSFTQIENVSIVHSASRSLLAFVSPTQLDASNIFC